MRHVTGTEKVLRNLLASAQATANGLERGLKEAGAFLLAESVKIVPVQTGNLRGSSFVRQFGSGFATDVVVGYTAFYAAYVHEDLTKAHGRQFNIKHTAEIAHAQTAGLKAGTAAGGMFPRGESQQAKYLEHPARQKRDDILKIIHRNAVRS